MASGDAMRSQIAHEVRRAVQRDLCTPVTAHGPTPASYLTDVPAGCLIRADGHVYEVSVKRRTNLGRAVRQIQLPPLEDDVCLCGAVEPEAHRGGCEEVGRDD